MVNHYILHSIASYEPGLLVAWLVLYSICLSIAQRTTEFQIIRTEKWMNRQTMTSLEQLSHLKHFPKKILFFCLYNEPYRPYYQLVLNPKQTGEEMNSVHKPVNAYQLTTTMYTSRELNVHLPIRYEGKDQRILNVLH